YIETGEELPNGAHAVKRFVEKPDSETAKTMIADGGFCWNSGMFIFETSAFLEECRQLAPEVVDAAEGAVAAARKDLDFLRLDRETFEKAPDISIDYAIFEKSERVAMV